MERGAKDVEQSKGAASPGASQGQTHDGLLLHRSMQCEVAGSGVHSGCCHRSPATQHCPRMACPDGDTELLKKASMKSTRVTSLSGSCPTGQEQQNVGCICFPGASGFGHHGSEPDALGCAGLCGVQVGGLELRVGTGSR